MVYFSLYSSGVVPLIMLTCIWYLAIRRIWSIRMFGLGISPKHAGMEKDRSWIIEERKDYPIFHDENFELSLVQIV